MGTSEDVLREAILALAVEYYPELEGAAEDLPSQFLHEVGLDIKRLRADHDDARVAKAVEVTERDARREKERLYARIDELEARCQYNPLRPEDPVERRTRLRQLLAPYPTLARLYEERGECTPMGYELASLMRVVQAGTPEPCCVDCTLLMAHPPGEPGIPPNPALGWCEGWGLWRVKTTPVAEAHGCARCEKFAAAEDPSKCSQCGLPVGAKPILCIGSVFCSYGCMMTFHGV